MWRCRSCYACAGHAEGHDGSISSRNRLMPAPGMDPAKLVGGSEADRRRILERMHQYLDVNARFDWRNLQDVFSAAPEAVFFNLNGHTYKGREHWTRLWQFYENNVRSRYWTPTDVGGVVADELAVVCCER